MTAAQRLKELADRLGRTPEDTLVLLRTLAADIEDEESTNLAEDLVDAATTIEEYLNADQLRAYIEAQL